jgi:hypothetical protein
MNLTNQPDPAIEIIDRLSRDYDDLNLAIADYDAQAAALPLEITTKEEHDRIADLVANIRKTAKRAENARTAEKAPYLQSERAVDGFFGPIGSALDRIAGELLEEITAYLNRIAAEEARRRREAAAKAAQEAEEARKREAEALRRANDEAAAKDRARAIADAMEHSVVAEAADARAAEETAAAAAKPAERARTRSASTGALSTLRSVWTHEVTSYDEIPLDRLRPYISTATIDQAIRQFIRNGGRELDGVRIFETAKGTVRG